jgi:7-cyano-7-deazaguanine reductase
MKQSGVQHMAKKTTKAARPETKNEELTKDLTLLGHEVRQPVRRLETFPNQHPARRYTVTLVCPEFTCVCPMTGQPDFATITIQYIPDQRIVESKSLKLYLWSYREEGVFHEAVTNQILDDLVAALQPISCHVTGAFSVRGGISITVDTIYDKAQADAARA